MAKILGISGSLRRRSFNTALLRAAAGLAPAGSEVAVETLHGVPLYDADVEQADGIPERVRELQSSIAASDGVLLVTPEYNAGVPGVAKNGIDWISRGDQGRVLKGKPVAIIGTGGNGGTRYSQSAWLPSMRMLGARLYSADSLFAARAWTLFSDEPSLSDAATREQLQTVVEGFAEFCAS